MERPIRILVSACLLGDEVRYDGGHKRDEFLVSTLGRFVEWVRVCPEHDCGMPIPRESMRLVGNADAPRLVTSRTGRDLTEQMTTFATRRLEELADVDLCGYICKKDSPSSGMERVKVYPSDKGIPSKTGAGIFTRMFMQRFPLIPVEEEGRLNDPLLREMFVERVFCLRRYRDMLADGYDIGRLVEFHTRHKMLLLSHSRTHYDAMGRLVAHARELPVTELFDRYQAEFMAALAHKTTPKRVADVLLHMLGHLKKVLDATDKQEMLTLIDRYRQGLVPLVVPLTLLGHHIRRHDIAYLREQVFLSPHPVELMLRNHV